MQARPDQPAPSPRPTSLGMRSDTHAPQAQPADDAAGSDSLAGLRVGVVGQGDVLARVLGQLHRLGAACVVLDDPYHAAAEIGHRPGSYAALVLCLPCCYTDELPVITAVCRCSPTTRVLVAAADQHVSMLTAALRLGAVGVLTGQGVEWIGVLPTPTPAALVAENAETAALAEPAEAETTVETPAEVTDEATDDMDDADSEIAPIEPVLTAEELHALLHDEPVADHRPAAPATAKGGRR